MTGLVAARPKQASGASRTVVVCEGNRVVTYYALASGAVKQPEAPGRLWRNMPDPNPVAVLGRWRLIRPWRAFQRRPSTAIRTARPARTVPMIQR
jgi:hypothetical protein